MDVLKNNIMQEIDEIISFNLKTKKKLKSLYKEKISELNEHFKIERNKLKSIKLELEHLQFIINSNESKDFLEGIYIKLKKANENPILIQWGMSIYLKNLEKNLKDSFIEIDQLSCNYKLDLNIYPEKKNYVLIQTYQTDYPEIVKQYEINIKKYVFIQNKNILTIYTNPYHVFSDSLSDIDFRLNYEEESIIWNDKIIFIHSGRVYYDKSNHLIDKNISKNEQNFNYNEIKTGLSYIYKIDHLGLVLLQKTIVDCEEVAMCLIADELITITINQFKNSENLIKLNRYKINSLNNSYSEKINILIEEGIKFIQFKVTEDINRHDGFKGFDAEVYICTNHKIFCLLFNETKTLDIKKIIDINQIYYMVIAFEQLIIISDEEDKNENFTSLNKNELNITKEIIKYITIDGHCIWIEGDSVKIFHYNEGGKKFMEFHI